MLEVAGTKKKGMDRKTQDTKIERNGKTLKGRD